MGFGEGIWFVERTFCLLSRGNSIMYHGDVESGISLLRDVVREEEREMLQVDRGV